MTKVFYFVDFFLWGSAHLGNADSVNPLMEGPDVIAAQILDVLGLFLDLRMLRGSTTITKSINGIP